MMRIDVIDNAGERLIFDWDQATGAISGPDGWWVDRILTLWTGVGGLGAAAPGLDPRRSAAGMASFLTAQGFDLPDDLRTALPPA